jgi:hypothetical protein
MGGQRATLAQQRRIIMATVESAQTPSAVAPAASSSLISGLSPDITPAQVLAIAGNVIAVAIAFGAHITKQQQDAILALVGVLGAFLVASDAHLRGRRAHARAIRHAAEVHAQTVTQAIAAGVAPPPPPTPQ